MQSLGLGAGTTDEEDTQGGAGYTGTNTTQVKSKANQTGTSTGGTGTTDDFIYGKTGSTFSYTAGEIDEEAVSSVLDAIAKTLKKLLDIVNSWL